MPLKLGKFGEKSPVDGKVVEIPLFFGVLAPSQVVVWDFFHPQYVSIFVLIYTGIDVHIVDRERESYRYMI